MILLRTLYSTVFFKDEYHDNCQELNKDTLFSALVSKPIKKKDQDKIDFNLDIPDLPQDRNFIKWQIPNTSNYEWIDYKNLMQNNNYLKVKTDRSCSPTSNTSSNNQMIDDEGFCSDKCSPIINTSRSKLQDSNNLWDNALKYTISEYIDWDMRAQHSLYISGLTENDRFKKKLLIDSDSFVFDQFYYHYLTTINIFKIDFLNIYFFLYLIELNKLELI